ncbi:LAGLIDADG family homing endonuclease [Candidatus Azambacteria bacterium]|nr:LAGLIDADG family homing endonuclease [Candidatus Azambacteria bacterium]
MRPLARVKIKWSPDFAYAIGLLTTDGNISPDRRHISFTSKDKELVSLFKKCFDLSNKITRKGRGDDVRKRYYLVQFGDVLFYRFLLSIGLSSAKSKTIGSLKVPDEYVFDFLRGHFDGDGTFYSYWDPRWKSSYMFYTVFISASKNHVDWLRRVLFQRLKINGHISKSRENSAYQLKYAKTESLKLLPKMYYSDNIACLSRKLRKVKKALATDRRHNS